MKFRLSALAASLAAVLALGLGPFLDRESALRHAATALAARHGLAESGLRDQLAARAWELGGWQALDLLQAALVALPALVAFLIALLILERLPRRFHTPGRWIYLSTTVVLFAGGLWHAHSTSRSALRDPRLLAPTELLARAARMDGRIFFDLHARHYAAMFAPGKLESGMDLVHAARLSASTVDWRAEDRANPFSAVLLTGRNAPATPLAQLLQTLPGWSTALTDNHGLLFVRGKVPVEEPSLQAATALMPNPRDRAVHLAQAALVQQSAGKPDAGQQLLRDALQTDPENAHVLVRCALFAAQEGRWRECREAAEAALAVDPHSVQAAHLQALALLESGAVAKAADRINPLATAHPTDTTLLALQARTARANNDPITEIQALEKLLRLAKRHGTPAGQIHSLLGQAWARRGYPHQALTHLQAALALDPPPEQRASLQESIELIRQRTR